MLLRNMQKSSSRGNDYEFLFCKKKKVELYIVQINNSKNTGIKTKLKALQTVSPIKGIIRGILFK